MSEGKVGKQQVAIKEDQFLLLQQQLESMRQMEELLKWSLAR
ncbi:hypothetical protein [Endozoicomonas sp. ALD040]